MRTAQGLIGCAMVWSGLQVLPAFSQDAILPHGDPRLRDDASEAQRREAVRDSRLKQQGPGPNYRVERSRQEGRSESTAGDPNGLARQDTGLADPSVNPGQASGMKVVRGQVTQANVKTIVVEDQQGKETTMSVDAATAGDRDVRPGDLITGTVTEQGRAVAIHKEAAGER